MSDTFFQGGETFSRGDLTPCTPSYVPVSQSKSSPCCLRSPPQVHNGLKVGLYLVMRGEETR